MKRPALITGSALLLLAAGCGGDGKALRLPADDTPIAAPTPLFTVGQAEGAPHEAFMHLAHAAFDAADNLYVLDSGAGTVYVYGPDGRFLRQVGRRGAGPGELELPVRLTVTPEGVMVVTDLRRRGFSLFESDGRYRETMGFPAGYGIGGLDLRPYPGGGFTTAYQPLPGADTGSVRLVRHPVTGNDAPQELHRFRTDGEVATQVTQLNGRVFLPGIYWGMLPQGGTALSRSAEYRVELTSPQGETAGHIERPIKPRSVTDADREGERTKRMEALEEDKAMPAVARQTFIRQLDDLQYASRMPVIRGMMLDAAGRIWVRRVTGVGDKGGVVDVLTADGRYLGTFADPRLPVAFSPSGRAAYLEEAESGAQRVVVRQVPAGWK